MPKKYDIICLNEVDSTNKYVKIHIDELDNLSVVSASTQTEGRGQGDHKWHSTPGENLLFSILLKNPDVLPADQGCISDAVAKSVVQLLEKHGIEAWIKPPNDIWVGDKKICGILIEHSLRAGRILWTIIGYEAVKIPLIGMGGISTARDVLEMMMAGATAVEVGAANLVNPFASRDIVLDLPRVMEKYKIEKLTDIIGIA